MPKAFDFCLDNVQRSSGTFLNSPISDPKDAQVVLLPVPYDATTSYRGGTRYGPKAIIAASLELEDYDLELNKNLSAIGIYTAPEIMPDASGPESMVAKVERAVMSVASRDKLIGLLGGEHTITVGAVRALSQLYPNMSVLYLDAHSDLRNEYMGTGWGHASVARRIHDLVPLTQVGVRSLSAIEHRIINSNDLNVVFWPPETSNVNRLSSDVLETLTENVYVSIDLDVFDPSIMAAVGTPEPGGMTWEEATGLLRSVSNKRRIVGFDITELSPSEGPEACAYIAAKLTYKLIGYATNNDTSHE